MIRYILLFVCILFILFLLYHKPCNYISDSFSDNHTIYQIINKEQLQKIFPDTQFNLWVSHYILIHYHGHKYLYKEFDNPGFCINDCYISFWFKSIDPYVLSKRKYDKYYFIISVWDGSYVETPMNDDTNEIQFVHSTSIDDFQIQKRSSPSVLPILHNKKYFGCFCKHVNDPVAILILDPLFIESNAYYVEKKHIDLYHETVTWKQKKNKIVYRGSIRNGSPYNFFNYHDMKNGHRQFLYENREKWKHVLDYESNYLSITDMCGFKYILDIDGWTNAWGLVWKLYSGSVVMKQDSIWKQWYYDDLKPFVHYIPIRNDFSDLEEKYQWCINHPDECRLIINNATRFVTDRLNISTATKHMQQHVWSQYFEKFSSF